MSPFECQCAACRDPNGQHHSNGCSQTVAIASHSKDAVTCLSQSSTLMTLVVGESEVVITCHKLLLAYYSGFFKVACYGSFQEAQEDKMAMPEDDPEEVKAFINWCYTGRLDRGLDTMNPQKLWVFGDQLDAPEFKNDVMALICDKYYDGSYELTAEDAEYVLDNSLSDSLLYRFTNEQIRTHGPFCQHTFDTVDEAEKEKTQGLGAWRDLISMGGDLVIDHLDGFCNDLVNDYPFLHWNAHAYMENTDKRTAKQRIQEIEGMAKFSAAERLQAREIEKLWRTTGACLPNGAEW